MRESLPIDRGIPMPPPSPTARRYPWETMEVTDSFLFPPSLSPTDCYKRVSQANDRYAPKRYMARKANGEVRCWRVA